MAAHVEVVSGIELVNTEGRTRRPVDWKRVGIAILRFLTVRNPGVDRLFETRDKFYGSPHRIAPFGEPL